MYRDSSERYTDHFKSTISLLRNISIIKEYFEFKPLLKDRR